MFTEQNYRALLERLKALSDEKYRIFNESLIPGVSETYGVRTPQLRSIAKEIIKDDWRGFLENASDRTHEELVLQGMVIAQSKCDIEEKLSYIREFVPKINNWAVCDVFCGDFKSAAKNRARVKKFLQTYLRSNSEFELRFGVVMLMDYFIVEEEIDETLKVLSSIRHEGYYVKMAVAWALSVCFVKFREKTLPVLERGVLDDETQNKAIQKCRESLRVSKEDKEFFKTLKRR